VWIGQSSGVPDVRWAAHQSPNDRLSDLDKGVLFERAASRSDQRGAEGYSLDLGPALFLMSAVWRVAGRYVGDFRLHDFNG
jgi:hypothetical protein